MKREHCFFKTEYTIQADIGIFLMAKNKTADVVSHMIKTISYIDSPTPGTFKLYMDFLCIYFFLILIYTKVKCLSYKQDLQFQQLHFYIFWSLSG